MEDGSTTLSSAPRLEEMPHLVGSFSQRSIRAWLKAPLLMHCSLRNSFCTVLLCTRTCMTITNITYRSYRDGTW